MLLFYILSYVIATTTKTQQTPLEKGRWLFPVYRYQYNIVIYWRWGEDNVKEKKSEKSNISFSG